MPAFLTVGLLGSGIGLAYRSLYLAMTAASACSGLLAGALPLRHYDLEIVDLTGPSGYESSIAIRAVEVVPPAHP